MYSTSKPSRDSSFSGFNQFRELDREIVRDSSARLGTDENQGHSRIPQFAPYTNNSSMAPSPYGMFGSLPTIDQNPGLNKYHPLSERLHPMRINATEAKMQSQLRKRSTDLNMDYGIENNWEIARNTGRDPPLRIVPFSRFNSLDSMSTGSPTNRTRSESDSNFSCDKSSEPMITYETLNGSSLDESTNMSGVQNSTQACKNRFSFTSYKKSFESCCESEDENSQRSYSHNSVYSDSEGYSCGHIHENRTHSPSMSHKIDLGNSESLQQSQNLVTLPNPSQIVDRSKGKERPMLSKPLALVTTRTVFCGICGRRKQNTKYADYQESIFGWLPESIQGFKMKICEGCSKLTLEEALNSILNIKVKHFFPYCADRKRHIEGVLGYEFTPEDYHTLSHIGSNWKSQNGHRSPSNSPRTPSSPRSPKSPKSPRTPKSRSPRSVSKSPRTPRSPRSPHRQRNRRLIHDHWLADDSTSSDDDILVSKHSRVSATSSRQSREQLKPFKSLITTTPDRMPFKKRICSLLSPCSEDSSEMSIYSWNNIRNQMHDRECIASELRSPKKRCLSSEMMEVEETPL